MKFYYFSSSLKNIKTSAIRDLMKQLNDIKNIDKKRIIIWNDKNTWSQELFFFLFLHRSHREPLLLLIYLWKKSFYFNHNKKEKFKKKILHEISFRSEQIQSKTKSKHFIFRADEIKKQSQHFWYKLSMIIIKIKNVKLKPKENSTNTKE